MILHFCEDIEKDFTNLNPEESLHTIKVLRKKIGDKLFIINGKGMFCEAEIINDNQKRCEIKILNRIFKENLRSYKIHIAIAPTKNIERFEWFVEKAVEIGIDEITPLLTTHSERKILKEERIEKIILSTIKQAQEFNMPVLNPMIEFNKFITNKFTGQKFIAHCYNDEKKILKDVYQKNNDVVILIGPEGDFSEKEVNLAIKNLYNTVSLGNTRLRTETAGIVACNTISIINQ